MPTQHTMPMRPTQLISAPAADRLNFPDGVFGRLPTGSTVTAAGRTPIADVIRHYGDVEGVFFGRDFVSVTAAPDVDWAGLEIDVVQILLDHFVSGAPLFRAGSAGAIHVAGDEDASFDEDPADAEIVEQIK